MADRKVTVDPALSMTDEEREDLLARRGEIRDIDDNLGAFQEEMQGQNLADFSVKMPPEVAQAIKEKLGIDPEQFAEELLAQLAKKAGQQQ